MRSVLGRAVAQLAERCGRSGVIINEHTPTREQLRRHIEVLSRWFEFIEVAELPRRIAEPRRRPFCLVTFDDGKRCNATDNAPELERVGVPAVFFVVTDFLTHGHPLWFDRYQSLVRHLGRAPSGLEPELVKRLPYDLLLARLDQASAGLELDRELNLDTVKPMSWDDARDLSRRGFTIGAHSTNHAILTLESPDAARENIAASLAEVDRQIGHCSTFAFPNGNYSAELALYAQACGATTVMTVEPKWVDPGCPLWRLPRVQIFGPDPATKIMLKMALAGTGRILSSPDGEGRRYVSAARAPEGPRRGANQSDR